MRSLLFVPGDQPRKIEKGLTSGADVLLVDLEDSVAPANKVAARAVARDAIAAAKAAGAAPRLFVRVNALDTGLTDDDLDLVMQAGPDGILLPKALSGMDVQHLAAKLAVREAENGLPDGGTVIVAIATETAASLFTMGSYRGATHRLAGLTWGAEDLSADLGAETNRTPDGLLTDPYRMARVLTLFAAHAAGVAAIDSVFTAFRDDKGLAAECAAARRDGFTAKMAIHPAQVPVINAAFTPTAEAVERARRIVALFEATPDAGVIGLDGEMLDRPHLLRARRLLDRAR
jgi:citrate lyase subunit beta/citryl-CoA lyase